MPEARFVVDSLTNGLVPAPAHGLQRSGTGFTGVQQALPLLEERLRKPVSGRQIAYFRCGIIASMT